LYQTAEREDVEAITLFNASEADMSTAWVFGLHQAQRPYDKIRLQPDLGAVLDSIVNDLS
jgi:hypothetical protein